MVSMIARDSLHNLVEIPQYRISMEVFCWIKPQVNPLLSIVKSVCINICLKNIWLPRDVAKKLKVYLISIGLIRGQLQCIAKQIGVCIYILQNKQKK